VTIDAAEFVAFLRSNRSFKLQTTLCAFFTIYSELFHSWLRRDIFPAVDVDDHTVDEAGLLGGKERYYCRDVFR